MKTNKMINVKSVIPSVDLDDDPLADLLDDLLPDEPKPRVQSAKPEAPPSASPKLKSETWEP